MKSKNFKRKLTLNKNTIADLTNEHLGIIKGGTGDSIEECIPPTEYIGCTVTCLVTCNNTCPSGGLAFACCFVETYANPQHCIERIAN